MDDAERSDVEGDEVGSDHPAVDESSGPAGLDLPRPVPPRPSPSPVNPSPVNPQRVP